jgi:hypothetical protein
MDLVGERAGIHGANSQAHRFLSGLPWQGASRVHAFPFFVVEPYLVRKVWRLNSTTVGTDSFDIGVFNEAGTTNWCRAVSTLTAGASVIQEVDVTDTLIPAGRYWCCQIQGGTPTDN